MKKLFAVIPFVALFLTLSHSCGDNQVEDSDDDTVYGIRGNVTLYNDYGQMESDFSGIQLDIYWVDSTDVDTGTSPYTYENGSYTAYTDAAGNYNLDNTPTGHYFITFTKDGYGNQAVYDYDFDSLYSDTLDDLRMLQEPYGEIKIDEISCDTASSYVLYSITRIITFTGSTGEEYGLTSRYFFNTDEDVSDENYLVTYVSGTAVRQGGTVDTVTVPFSIENLTYSGYFDEGDTVFVRAYVDNYYTTSYQTGEDSYVFPNLTGESDVYSFGIFVTPDDD